VKMYEKLSIPAMGLIENMSHFVCPTCHTESDIFGKGGGEALAREMTVPFLGRIPIYEPIRVGGDTGVPILVGEPSSPAAESFRQAAERLASQIAILALKPQSKAIPLTQVR
jgi:ATP-binding protein involved in chromosome partitioning